MMVLRAPYASAIEPSVGAVTALLLPNPELGDSEGQDLALNQRRAINGTRYSYVKTSSRKLLTFTWSNLGRGKLVEIQEFYKLYAGSHALLTDHRGDIWDVTFVNEPSVTTNSRAAPLTESGSITLEFIGESV